jgi:outer membrane immunogenic protein
MWSEVMYRTVSALLVAAALASVPHHAGAADMPVPAKAPIVSAPGYNWTGFYGGLNVGWGWASADWTNVANATLFGDSVPPDTFSRSAQGVTGGGQIGFNYQTGVWVLGVEALLNGSDIHGDRASTFGAADDHFTWSIDALLLVTARVGIAHDRWLAYAKGGYAGAVIRTAVSDTVGPATGSGSDSQWRSGWIVGGGVEYGLTPNLSLAVEYNYVELESGRYEIGGGAGSYAWDVRTGGTHLALVKLSYRFAGLR